MECSSASAFPRHVEALTGLPLATTLSTSTTTPAAVTLVRPTGDHFTCRDVTASAWEPEQPGFTRRDLETSLARIAQAETREFTSLWLLWCTHMSKYVRGTCSLASSKGTVRTAKILSSLCTCSMYFSAWWQYSLRLWQTYQNVRLGLLVRKNARVYYTRVIN